MKKLLTITSVFALFILGFFSGCGPSPTPKETLPPATQTGANTFGCLVNGKVWLPKGYDGTSNLTKYYDPNFNGKPIFNVTGYRIISDVETQDLGLSITGIYKPGSFDIANDTIASSLFSTTNCYYFYHDSAVYRKGSIVITKLSLPIISGTFDFVIYKSGCDTIKLSQGRFDFKL